MSGDKESVEAKRIRARLFRDAEGDVTGLRQRTLQRFFQACDDIVTGEAFRMASRVPGVFDPKPFRARKLTATCVGKYIQMRAALCRAESKISKNEWTGPVRETIAGDRDLRDYIAARNYGLEQLANAKVPLDIEIVIDRVTDPGDRRMLRAMMNELSEVKDKARRFKVRNDMLLHQFKLLTGVDFTDFVDGKAGPAPFAVHKAGGNGAILKRLLERITDNLFLEPFGLTFRNNRVKAYLGDESDLIYPEEMDALKSILL